MTQAFNLSQLANKVNTSGQLDASTGLYNQTPVANGGTGKSSVTSGALLLGAGTSAMTELTGTTPGTVVASSPTGWSAVPTTSVGGGNYIMRTYTSPSPWTKPAALKAVKVTVIGAGGNGGSATAPTGIGDSGGGGGGGGGGTSIRYIDAPAIPGPVAVTAGPGTNSFGAFASATAGSAGGNGSSPAAVGAGGAGGTGSSGTINIPGGSGYSGGVEKRGGNGVNSIFTGKINNANPTTSITTTNAPGINGDNYGNGGSGGLQRSGSGGTSNGGTGAPGIVIVEEYY